MDYNLYAIWENKDSLKAHACFLLFVFYSGIIVNYINLLKYLYKVFDDVTHAYLVALPEKWFFSFQLTALNNKIGIQIEFSQCSS